ncbi:fibronectin type III domain-containing protein [Aquimarina hainanensis]|uniref:Fibronectin type III domain-containing protein n=1 Tax=Aquimarina hainanensis TaxID=1578017 RepID=A0ABW5N622_9FLAO
MKKLLLAVFGLSCSFIQGQYVSGAPWMETLQQKERSVNSQQHTPTLEEITAAFQEYWKDKDHTVKGSGYKPYMRWQEYWKYSVLPDGTIPSSDILWNAWEKKEKLSIEKNSSNTFWAPMGPFDHNQSVSWSPGQGRVNVAMPDPNNPNILYVGAPAGGLWKSTDRGANWIPLTDKIPQIGVSGIAIDPNNSDIIYISTGDDDNRDSYSIGVLKSTDGGATWARTGLVFSSGSPSSNDIYIDPSNSNVLWIATNSGVYKTTDAGVSWRKTLNGNIKDIKLKPGDASVIYAASTSAFYKSTDGGNNFTQITAGLPTQSSRLVIDVTPADPNYVYLVSSDYSYVFQGLYRSTDSGTTFTKTRETKNIFENTQSWYDLALSVSDTNPNVVFVGCLNIWKSTNGGDTFNRINYWASPKQVTYTHADIHYLRYFNGELYCGSDGGFYLSNNDGATFTSYTKGLQIGQFYKISVAQNSSSDRLVGGLQDNGGFGLRGTQWNVYHGADGMDCVVDTRNPNVYYGFIQYGRYLYKTEDRGLSNKYVASGPSTGNWVTPLAMDTDGVIYAGYKGFYKLEGNAFTKISTFNFTGNIDHIEIDPHNNSTIYVAHDYNLHKSTDKGINWTKIHTFREPITSIEVNNDNGNTLYVTTGVTYSGGVYKSVNQGVDFENITGNLPHESKFVVKHQKGSDIIYLGTYLGVYLKNGNGEWINYSNNLPNASIRDLEINLQDNVLIAATYGRGVWKVPLSSSNQGENPSAPTNFSAKQINKTNVNLVWDASVDNTEVAGYKLYQDGILITTTNKRSATISQLNPSTSYNFKIKAFDIDGNASEYGNSLTVTTTDGSIEGCSSTISVYPYHEGYENTLGAWVQSSNDHLDWTIQNGRTPTAGTGPSYPQEGTYYLYVKASENGVVNSNKQAILTSPCFNLSSGPDPVFSFSYHMYGDGDMGNLSLEASAEGEANWISLWHLTGNKGDGWYNTTVSLSPFLGRTVKLRFNRAVGASENADIAIDNIALSLSGNNRAKTSYTCSGIAPWDSQKIYKVGERALFENTVSERTTSGWKNLGSCTSSTNGATFLNIISAKTPPANNELMIKNNPVTNGTLTVSLKSPAENASYQLIDLHGKTVGTGLLKTHITVDRLKPGTYLLKVTTNEHEFLKRFVKQ